VIPRHRMSIKAFPTGSVGAVGLLLAIGAVAGLVAFHLHRPKSPPPSAARSELRFRDGRWLWTGESRPFTGVMVDAYDSGVVKSRAAVSNGLLEGLSEGWFTNGQRQVQETFRAGVSHGLRTKWHANGRKMSEGLVVNGKLEGIFRRWSEDGSLSEEIEMKDGAANGISRAYHADGSLRALARVENGRALDQRFWPPGERRP
jgi:antitoxin component YwqK of YwqJK toxin-antitoxin module